MNHTVKVQMSESMTVAEIAVSYPEAIEVFKRFDIDYCCGGNISLKEACDRIDLEPAKILDSITRLVPGSVATAFRIQDWTCSLIVDYIVQNHHSYVRNVIPEIRLLLSKVVKSHGQDQVELVAIQDEFNALADELLHHMHKEEFILFPAIKRLESGIQQADPLAVTIQAPLISMEHEHESAGKIIKSIRLRSKNYTAPDYSCPTFKVLYKKLEEFEQDLLTHIHLENNVLFQRVKDRGRPQENGVKTDK